MHSWSVADNWMTKALMALFFGLCCFANFSDANQFQAADIRVVIDISGSMKKTDPQNLRKPAVDLIVRLLPDKSKASIWTFGRSVNVLVPHRVVDDAWRKDAIAKAESINSIALYTNIGSALEKSSALASSPDYQTHIILLTDGVVDITSEAVENTKERARILKEILPGIKNKQFKIHTIALSDAADQELMKKLSLVTDGVNQVATSADELMSTFLRIFDQAVPAERVPLDDEGFLVDASVKEFTALIFRKDALEKTIISDSQGKLYESTDPANNVNWYRTPQYDLVTVQHPVAGKWKVITSMAPDSRVTVVSDLSLQVKASANNLKRNQQLSLTYQFTESNTIITKPEFLKLLSADLVVSHRGEITSSTESLTTKKVPEDGVFHHSLNGFSQAGDYDLKLIIDGKTFRREFAHHFSVADQNFKLEKSVKTEANQKVYSYKIMADLELVDTSKTTAKAIIKNSQQQEIGKELTIIGNEQWEMKFSPVQIAKYTVSFVMNGVGADAAPFQETLFAEEFYYPNESSVKADEETKKLAAEAARVEVEEVVEEQPASKPNIDPNLVEEGTDKTPWILYASIGIANLLLLGLGYLAYRMFVGKKGKDELDEIEQTLNLDASAIKGSDVKSEPKTVIDVSEENEAHIPIKDIPKTADDSMAESLFPLENQDDSGDKQS